MCARWGSTEKTSWWGALLHSGMPLAFSTGKSQGWPCLHRAVHLLCQLCDSVLLMEGMDITKVVHTFILPFQRIIVWRSPDEDHVPCLPNCWRSHITDMLMVWIYVAFTVTLATPPKCSDVSCESCLFGGVYIQKAFLFLNVLPILPISWLCWCELIDAVSDTLMEIWGEHKLQFLQLVYCLWFQRSNCLVVLDVYLIQLSGLSQWLCCDWCFHFVVIFHNFFSLQIEKIQPVKLE